MTRFKMTPDVAAGIASRYGFTLSGDFHALHSDAVAGIIAAADAWRYRHRRGANGSRARCYYYYLQRAYNREGK